MGKTMAIISGGVVENIVWCGDFTQETDPLKNPMDRPVGIGDTYSDGKWYRNGVEILTPLEEAQKEIENLQNQIEDMDSAYREGVNSI